MNIHHDLESIKLVAIEEAKKHNCNYNVILCNPNEKGEFDEFIDSTYEFVTDSYFEKPRPNVILLHKTDDLLIENNPSPTPTDKEVDKLVSEIIDSAERRADMSNEIQQLDMQLKTLNSTDERGKLKKGLAIHHASTDGVKYIQGKSGLERIKNTNRNDKCNCGSGKKFKNCCGK